MGTEIFNLIYCLALIRVNLTSEYYMIYLTMTGGRGGWGLNYTV
jgi:hypothetical protein